MDTQELIGLARELAGEAGGRRRRTPRQTDLRRAVSSAYYAMFHTLCSVCADMLAGSSPESRERESWQLAYRALEHGYTRSRFRDDSGMERFPRPVRHFGELFLEMQASRQSADYDPNAYFDEVTVRQSIEDTSQAIAEFTRAPEADLRDLALYVLLRPRRD